VTAPDQDALKRAVGEAAVDEVEPGSLIGVGTGSTVNCFVDALAARGVRLEACVSSSEATTARLVRHGYCVVPADAVERLGLYVDGADEIDPLGRMVKGGGAALTREKIVADLAERFVCIADGSKQVERLGRFPLPVEIVPMAAARLVRRFAALGGDARLRAGVTTDNGGAVLDVHGLAIDDPVALESAIDHWPGVVTVGLFARRGADLALLASAGGVRRVTFARGGALPESA
jgi:ribose 5-phosphate isomerase A